jgi:hypothetical protein
MALSFAFPTALDVRFDISAAEPGLNPYSARGMSGTLKPIALATGDDKLARTVNGTLIDISAPQMRKYRLEVQGDDVAPPALDRLWVGMLVYVDAMVELAYWTGGSPPGDPGRSAVSGSVRTEGNYTYYQPHFTMRVVELELTRQEWASAVSWSLVFEEV